MSDEREIRISESEAWRLYLLLEEMNDFLHQDDNYRSVEKLNEWLEGKGIYKELSEVFYRVVAPWFPVDEESGYVVEPGGVLHKDE